QNRSAKYPASVRDRGIGGTSRSFTNALLSCSLPNGQTVTRQWLLYSPSTGCVYCFACKLFSSKHNTFVHGFSDWKHSERIGEHEGSVEHRACMLALYNRSRGTATIDSDIVKQIDAERQYWREVLKRVVAVIQFLGERGLAFRGDDELLGSAHNGNFLGIIELLAKFDPFLAEHLQRFGGKGKGSVSYLSSTVCEEFIHLMGQRTKQAIVNEIKESKYFSVIVDSTPDLAHVDQLTFIFRFVNNDGHVVERFLAFEPIENHSGDSLAECVVAMVENLGLDLSNCRGQSYDNASNMSGKYNGIQAHLKQRNPLICYVPCAAHSLNLVGVNAVDSSPEAGRFFDFVQAMYTFCASSTHRWGKVFHMEEKCVTRSEASALCDKLDTLEMAFMAYFWDTILQRFQASSLQLQKHDIDICTATQLLLSLRDFVAAQRDNFEVFEGAALNVTTAVSQEYRHDLQRTKKRKIMSDDSAEPGVAFNGKDKFRIETFNVVIDKLVSCLNHRLNAYTHLTELFDVLFMPDNMSNSELTLKANSLAAAYPSDLNMSLADELIQYKSFITEKEKHPSKMLKTMINLNLQSTFPNVYIALRLFLTVPITNCEGERSFSKLARIKNELRIRMRQNRLNSLSLLAIESDLVRQLNFDELVDDFARKKSRKKHI
uniref:TTF-type domain-containing protein n=1 Tax=Astyanax mexicanus TaxID=7994 RepID=A0A3B1JTW1_ASTMX